MTGSKLVAIIFKYTTGTSRVLGASIVQRRPSAYNRGSEIDRKRSTNASKIGTFSSRYIVVVSQSMEE